MTVKVNKPNMYPGPEGDTRRYDINQEDDFVAWNGAWAAWNGDDVEACEAEARDIFNDVPERRTSNGTNAPRDPEAKAREAEALAYIATYTGKFGLILDLKADKRFGTKYMSLTERQVAAVLASKEREAQWAREAAAQANDPRQVEAREFLNAYAGDFSFLIEMKAHTGTFSDGQVNAILRCKARETPRISDGVFQSPDGTIFKVQKAVHGSGNLYAKVFNVATQEFEYAPGVVNTIRPEWKMTPEQASEFGRLYGRCVNCGRTLTWEKSIERAMGPICYGRMFGG